MTNMKLTLNELDGGLWQVRREYDDGRPYKVEGTYHSREAAEERLLELKTLSIEDINWSMVGRERSLMRKTFSGGHNGGRPRSNKRRCPCGEMTLKRAEARAHKCTKAGPIKTTRLTPEGKIA